MNRLKHASLRKKQDEERQHGFSLVELLVSLTIASIILGLLGSTVYSFTEGWARQQALIEKQDMIRRGVGILRRDLRSLQRINDSAGETPRLAFRANPTSLRFVTLVPGYASRQGAVFIKYSIEQRRGVRTLVRRVASYRRNAALSSIAYRNPVEILTGYPDLTFSFKNTDTQSWQSAWSRTDTLPGLVRLRFGLRDATTYPSALIAIRALADQACVAAFAPPCTISVARR